MFLIYCNINLIFSFNIYSLTDSMSLCFHSTTAVFSCKIRIFLCIKNAEANIDLHWLIDSILHLGQDLIQHNSSGANELNGNLRLATPTINNQSAGATLTISNDQLLSQSPVLNSSSGRHLIIFLNKSYCGVLLYSGLAVSVKKWELVSEKRLISLKPTSFKCLPFLLLPSIAVHSFIRFFH